MDDDEIEELLNPHCDSLIEEALQEELRELDDQTALDFWDQLSPFGSNPYDGARFDDD